MPELPEVEVVVRGLRQHLIGQKLQSVKIQKGRTNFTASEFNQKVKNQTIQNIERIGKMIVIHLNKNLLIFHLKMTGQLIYENIFLGGHSLSQSQKTYTGPFTRLIFTLKGGAKLYFNDQRRFGYCHLIEPADLAKYRQNYGIDPIKDELTWSKFQKLIQKYPHSRFKSFLLNQKHLAGIGNIYADEIAHACQIHPEKPLGQISLKKWQKIHKMIPQILTESIAWNGTTFSSFLQTDGKQGNFWQFLKAYGQNGQPCSHCQRPLIKIKVAGRGTVYCQKCQKK